jgi:anti-sigma regulatory factor (Ser/Thr protein kinase)
MCYVVRCALDRNANAVGLGRRFIAAQLAQCGLASSDGAVTYLDDVLLATSELLANAVKFGDGELDLCLQVHRDEIKVQVADDNPAQATRRSPEVFDESGRGLALVEAVATRWGQERRGTGKAVWCSFSLPPGRNFTGDCGKY